MCHNFRQHTFKMMYNFFHIALVLVYLLCKYRPFGVHTTKSQIFYRFPADLELGLSTCDCESDHHHLEMTLFFLPGLLAFHHELKMDTLFHHPSSPLTPSPSPSPFPSSSLSPQLHILFFFPVRRHLKT